ncbi:MAG: class I tRNA ligase family protein [Ignavibacteria bacterium]
MKFNTAISYLMIFVNELYKLENYSKSVLEKFILLLSPFAPHISEELWEILGNKNSIVKEPSAYDKELIKEEKATIIFSVNGKVRSKQDFAIDTDVKVLEDEALDNENVKKYILGKKHC